MPITMAGAAGAGSSPVWQSWGGPLITIVGAVVLGLVLHALLFGAVIRLARRRSGEAGVRTLRRISGAARLVMPTLLVQFTLPAAGLSASAEAFTRHAAGLVMIVAVTWALILCVGIGADELLKRHRIDVADNLRARQAHTQIRVLARSISIVIGVVGAAVALMTFPQVRQVGASLLASAGLAGLVIGIAARPLVANLIAGIQLVFTQPINVDDVVIVEGEWGRVEEFTPTYVVIRIWDERRLIVPLGYFLENPFQNWTRRTSQILGTVFIHTDYTVPVDAVRAEVERIVKARPEWDGRVQLVQVTDATKDGVQLRVLVSAPDAGKAFDLRCHVREKVIEFLQREHPGSLPRIRAELREAKPLRGSQPEHQQHGPAEVGGGAG